MDCLGSLVVIAPARRTGDPGSNPCPGENFSLKLLIIKIIFSASILFKISSMVLKILPPLFWLVFYDVLHSSKLYNSFIISIPISLTSILILTYQTCSDVFHSLSIKHPSHRHACFMFFLP